MPEIIRITPTNQTIYWDRSGSTPNVTTLAVAVISQEPIEYVQFYIERISGNVDWLTSEKIGEYLPTGGGTIPLNLINLDQLYPGNHKTEIKVIISNSEGYSFEKYAYVNFNISGPPTQAITTDKQNYNVVFVRESNTFSGETEIVIINNSDNGDIEFSTIGTLLKESTVTSEILIEEDPAFPFSTNSELPTTGTKVINCRLKKNGAFVYDFTVTIAVIENDEIICSPEYLEFKLRKGYNEVDTKTLLVINPLGKDFIATGPDWLNFSENAGNATMDFLVFTDNSETLSVGNHYGNIEIAYDGKITYVPVSLQVVEFISIPDRKFCLDDIILTATRQNEEAKILRISLSAKFQTSEAQFINEVKYDIMYQNGFAKTDIGKKINRMFPRNRKSSFLLPKTKPFDNMFVLKPAEITLQIDEMDINYVVKKTVSLPTLFLYPGKKPKMYPLMTNHNIRSRRSDSAHIFSYMADEVSAIDIVGNVVASNPTQPKEIHTVKIDASDNLIGWTDKKSILGVDYYKLEEKTLIHCEWQNQNMLPEWFSFTGGFARGKNKNHIYQDNSFTENNEKFDVIVGGELKLNTGFILKAEAYLIDELEDSKLCFLRINEKIYEAFSTSSKIIMEDSAQELCQYEVEFFIVQEL